MYLEASESIHTINSWLTSPSQIISQTIINDLISLQPKRQYTQWPFPVNLREVSLLFNPKQLILPKTLDDYLEGRAQDRSRTDITKALCDAHDDMQGVIRARLL